MNINIMSADGDITCLHLAASTLPLVWEIRQGDPPLQCTPEAPIGPMSQICWHTSFVNGHRSLIYDTFGGRLFLSLYMGPSSKVSVQKVSSTIRWKSFKTRYTFLPFVCTCVLTSSYPICSQSLHAVSVLMDQLQANVHLTLHIQGIMTWWEKLQLGMSLQIAHLHNLRQYAISCAFRGVEYHTEECSSDREFSCLHPCTFSCPLRGL